MKLGPVTKTNKRNKTTSKNDNDVISENYDVIVIFFFNFELIGAFQNLDSECRVFKSYVSINSNLLSFKN